MNGCDMLYKTFNHYRPFGSSGIPAEMLSTLASNRYTIRYYAVLTTFAFCSPFDLGPPWLLPYFSWAEMTCYTMHSNSIVSLEAVGSLLNSCPLLRPKSRIIAKYVEIISFAFCSAVYLKPPRFISYLSWMNVTCYTRHSITIVSLEAVGSLLKSCPLLHPISTIFSKYPECLWFAFCSTFDLSPPWLLPYF